MLIWFLDYISLSCIMCIFNSMLNRHFTILFMTRSFSNTFVPQLVACFLQIQKEEFDGANRHFDKMLCLPRNHHDDEIIWFAKAHIYKN